MKFASLLVVSIAVCTGQKHHGGYRHDKMAMMDELKENCMEELTNCGWTEDTGLEEWGAVKDCMKEGSVNEECEAVMIGMKEDKKSRGDYKYEKFEEKKGKMRAMSQKMEKKQGKWGDEKFEKKTGKMEDMVRKMKEKQGKLKDKLQEKMEEKKLKKEEKMEEMKSKMEEECKEELTVCGWSDDVELEQWGPIKDCMKKLDEESVSEQCQAFMLAMSEERPKGPHKGVKGARKHRMMERIKKAGKKSKMRKMNRNLKKAGKKHSKSSGPR